MQTNAKTIQIKSNAAAAQKLRAEPGQAMAIVIDGVPFTGQKQINGKAVQLVRKGRALELHLEGQDHAAVVVEDFYAATDASEVAAAPQTLNEQEVHSLMESGTSQQWASADSAAAPSLPAWGTLVAQASTTATAASTASTAAATSATVAAAEAPGIGALLFGALGIAAVTNSGSSEPAPTSTVTGTVTLGPVIAGHQLTVQLYQADGTTALGNPVAVGADGRFTATVTGYTGVIKAKLMDGGTGADFKDEATNANKDVNAEFWAVGTVASGGTVTLNINPLTTLAFKKLGANPTEAQVNAALAAVETAFGLTSGSLKSTTPIATNSDAWAAADNTSAAAKLGMALATLSGLDALNGGDMAKTINDLAPGIGTNGTLSDAAKNQLLAGAAQADATVAGGLTATIAKTVDSGAQAAATAFTPSTDVTTLSAAAVALLSNAQLEAMTSTQIGNLASSQLAALTGPQITALGNDITGLSAAQVAALSNTQLQALSADQKTALKAAGDLSSLSAAQLQLLDITDAAGTVAVTGNATQNQTLTAALPDDADGGVADVTYQWKAGGVNISGATTNTLVLTQAHVGKAITVVATYKDNLGSSKTATSTATVAVVDVNDPATGTVTISGTAEEGGTLTAVTSGVSDPDGTSLNFTYQWQIADTVDGSYSNIVGATNSTYQIAADQSQVGKFFKVVATATNDGVSGGTAFTSAATSAAANVNDAATGTVTISGTAEEGGTLTAVTSGVSDPDGTSLNFTYQWQIADTVDGSYSNIVGATNSTYQIAADQSQVGKFFKVVATATNDGVSGGTAFTSAATLAAAEVNEAPVVANDGVTVGNMVAGAASGVAVTGLYAKGSTTNLLSGLSLTTTSAYGLGETSSFSGEKVGGGYNYLGSPNWLSTNLVNTGKITALSQLDGGFIEFADGKKGVIWVVRDGGGAENSYIYYHSFDSGLDHTKPTLLATETQALTLTAAQLLANDTDDSVGAMTISAVTGQVRDANNNVVGAATLSGGNIVFTPDASLVSAMDIFDVRNATINYTVSDAQGLTSQATATINIMGANNAPTVVNDGVTLGNSIRGALTGATVTGLYARGSNTNLLIGKPALTVTQDYVEFGQGNFGNGDLVRDGYNYVGGSNWFVANGVSLAGLAGGVIEFSNGIKGVIRSANNGAVGVEDSWIYYRAYDSGVVAGQLIYETTEDLPLTISGTALLANDTDRQGALSIASVTSNVLDGNGNVVGTAALNSGNIIFTPDASLDSMGWGEVRNATISYKVKDVSNLESTATVTINILGENNAPLANPDGAVLMNQQATGAVSGMAVTGLYARGSTTNLMTGKSSVSTSDNYQQSMIALGEGAALLAGGNSLSRSGWFAANGFYDLSVFEGGMIKFADGTEGILHSVSDGPAGSLSRFNYSSYSGLDTSQRYFVGNTQAPFLITASELMANDTDETPSLSVSAVDSSVTDGQGNTVATAVLNNGVIQIVPLANVPMASGAADLWRLTYSVRDVFGKISAGYASLNVLKTHDFDSVSSQNGISVQAAGQQSTRFNVVVDGNSLYAGSPSATGSLSYWIKNSGNFRDNTDSVTSVAIGGQAWSAIANNISDVNAAYKSGYKNIIFLGEGNNSLYSESITVESVWQSAVDYVQAVKNNHSDWVVVLGLDTPANEPLKSAGQNDFYNQRLIAWNDIAKANYLAAGFDYLVDYRYAGSVFEKYDLNSFNQNIDIWADRWIHPNSNGKAIMADNLIQKLFEINSLNTYSISFDFTSDPGATFAWDGVNGDIEVHGGELSALTGSGTVRSATFTPSSAAVLGLEIPYIRVKPFSYSTASGLNPVEELLYLDVVAPVAKTLTAAARTYVAGDWLDVSIRFSEHMVFSGASSLRLLIGNAEKTATFSSYDANGRTAVFRYQIESGLSDSDGVTVVSAANVADQFNNSWVFNNLQLNSNAVIQA